MDLNTTTTGDDVKHK